MQIGCLRCLDRHFGDPSQPETSWLEDETSCLDRHFGDPSQLLQGSASAMLSCLDRHFGDPSQPRVHRDGGHPVV